MLMYVLDSEGSSPGRKGFSMVVNDTGEMRGSLGGGIMEHKLVELAKVRLKNGDLTPTVIPQYHNKEVNMHQSGMICSGAQHILFFPLRKSDVTVIEKVINQLQQNKACTITLSPDGLKWNVETQDESVEYTWESKDNFMCSVTVGRKLNLYIIGGGHCALAFSKIMRDLGFYIRLYETRDNINTLQVNKHAHEIYIVSDYSELKQHIAGGENDYLVIMTFGYRTDDIALRALLDKTFRYFGVMGSKNKIATMKSQYQKEGIDEKLLERIYMPIGIPIKSQTPEEIAVSIAAQIIAIKNGASI